MMSNLMRGILSLIGGVCFHIVIGCIYLWGGIAGYVASFYHSDNQNMNEGILMFFVPLRGVAMLLLLPVGGILEKKYGPRPGIAIGGISVILFVLLTSFFKSGWIFIFFFGLAFGISAGFGYVAPISCCWKYFPNNKGIVSGIILCGYGMGSFIFTFVATAIANPYDETPVKEGDYYYFSSAVYDNVPKLFRFLALFWGILCLIAFIFLGNPPNYKNQQKKSDQLSENNSTIKDEESNLLQSSTEVVNESEQKQISYSSERKLSVERSLNNICPNVKTGLRSSQFILLTLMLTFSVCNYLLLNYFFEVLDFFMAFAYKDLGEVKKFNDSFLSLVGSIYAVCNGSVRILWGQIYDKIGFKRSALIIFICQGTLSATLWFGGINKPLFMIWVIGIVIFVGGNFPTFPPVCNEIFGKELGAQLYGYVVSGFTISSILVFFLNLYLVPYVGYKYMLFISAGLSYVNILLLFFLKLDPKWSTKENRTDDNSSSIFVNKSVTPNTSH